MNGIVNPLSRLVVATHNPGKLKEFRALLCPYFGEITSAGELGIPAPDETEDTFVANAVLKAKAVSEASGCVALSDDGGLCVSAMNGRPGVHSARLVLESGGLEKAMDRIQQEIGESPDRSAYFISVLAVYHPSGAFKTVEGRVYGSIAKEQKGSNGHGYDPIFIPDGYTQTFAELSQDVKNSISHRGKAVSSLLEMFRSNPNLFCSN